MAATSGHIFWALLQEWGKGGEGSEGWAGPLVPLWKVRSLAGYAFGLEDMGESLLSREGWGPAGWLAPMPKGKEAS